MYAAVTAVIFAKVAILHFVRLIKRWPIHIGSHAVPMSLSWVGLAVSALLAVWGLMQSGG